MSPPWLTQALGWREVDTKLKGSINCLEFFGRSMAPNTADIGSVPSLKVAADIYDQLGIDREAEALDLSEVDEETAEEAAPRSDGIALERFIADDVQSGLETRDNSRDWEVTRSGEAADYVQFRHLREMQVALKQPSAAPLRAFFQSDYHVKTDVFVGVKDPSGAQYLHAAIASKWTIRSDRVQNIRQEFSTLVRNRRGRLPHLMAVTAEPLPRRLNSIASGTGEVDACYSLIYHEIAAAIVRLERESPRSTQATQWRLLVDQGRVRPYSELVDTLLLT